MCEAIIDLFRDEYDKGIAETKELGIQLGAQQALQEKMISLFRKGLLNEMEVAVELNVTVEEFMKLVKEEDTIQVQET